MDLSTLIPTPDWIPVHWGWLKFLLLLTFTLHIVLVNIMVGTGIIALFSSPQPHGRSESLQKTISEKLTFVIAFTINFGVAPLLFLQVLYGHFMYVSSLLMAVYWLSIIGLLIIAYYSAYYYKFKFEALKEKRTWFIGAAVLIFLIIGFLFTNNMTLMLTPKTWLKYFDNPNGTVLNLSDPTLLPRFLHFVIASIAVGGLSMAAYYERKRQKGAPDASIQIERGMKWFTWATIAQIGIGFWFQMSLPQAITLLFMGGAALHTLIFLFSLLLTIAVLYFGMKQKIWMTVGLTAPLICSMILMRDLVRTAYLEPFFNLSDLTIVGRNSPLILFLLSLAGGTAAVCYVLRIAMKPSA